MTSATLPLRTSSVAVNFWPAAHNRLDPKFRSVRAKQRTAVNLFELFVHDLSLLVAGACLTERVARALFDSLPPDRPRLRQLVLGLNEAARGCVPALPTALEAEGLELPATRADVIEILLKPINPDRRGATSIEPRSVAGARMVGTFTHVALHFKTEAAHAAEDARLLGSDRLGQTLASWSRAWSNYLRDLRLQERKFRAQAYAADLAPPPVWQTA